MSTHTRPLCRPAHLAEVEGGDVHVQHAALHLLRPPPHRAVLHQRLRTTPPSSVWGFVSQQWSSKV